MHELAICQALLEQVEALARQRNATAVNRIVLRVGPLSGVVPELLARAFTVANHRKLTASAALVIEDEVVRVVCAMCAAHTDVPPNRLLCGQCGNWRTRVVAGNELHLASVEMQAPTPVSAVGATCR